MQQIRAQVSVIGRNNLSNRARLENKCFQSIRIVSTPVWNIPKWFGINVPEFY